MSKIKLDNSYSDALAKMYNWNYTTVLRTHYKLKPHIADKKVEKLIRAGCVSNIFYCIEQDRDSKDRYTNNRVANHLHLLMDVRSVIKDIKAFRRKIAIEMGVNPKSVLDIEPIRGKQNIARYIIKHFSDQNSHHNYFVTE